jgi:hypothetical protein
MAKSKKLKVGDRVICRFLGMKNLGTVTEITSPSQYKVKLDKGTILPKSEWYDPTDKKHAAKPWHIHEYIGCTELNEIDVNSDISDNTLDKKELKNAIQKQKDFVRGKAKK